MKITYILVIALAALFIFGCAENAEEYKIGFVGPLTGDVATLAESAIDSMTLAAEEINANGGVNGKQIKIILEDGQCNGQKAVTAAQKLINIDKVDLIVPFCSPETLSIAPVAEATNTIVISTTSTNPDVKFAGDYIFRIVPSDSGQGKEGAKLMEKAGLKNIAILYANNDWGHGMRKVFRENFNGEVVAEDVFEMDTTDLKTQLSKIKEKNPDGLFMLAYAKQATIILKQMQELNINIPVYAADATKDDAVLKIASEIGLDIYVTAPGVPESNALQEYDAKLKQRFGRGYSAYGPEGYDVVYIAKQMFEAAETSEEMKEYLYNMPDFSGVSGKFKFDSFGEVEKPYDLFTIKEGEFVKVT
jgi:branched-chain amino acid transport system substrate-binding protein